MGGNKAVREWVGKGLKALGEMIEREQESEEGEREDVVREVFVSPLSSLVGTERRTDDLSLLATRQNVLKASLLATDSSDEASSPNSPPLEDLQERYGTLFGHAVYDRWDAGGRDIFEAVPGAGAGPVGEEEPGSAME
jgi:transcription initiation factor TFIID subunit 6